MLKSYSKVGIQCNVFLIFCALGVAGYGIWCLVESSEDVHSDQAADFNQIVEEWQAGRRRDFENLNVTIQAKGSPSFQLEKSYSVDKDVTAQGFYDYDHLKYDVQAQIFSEDINDYYNMTSAKYMGFNFTQPITITINNSEIPLNATVYKKQEHHRPNHCHAGHKGVYEIDTRNPPSRVCMQLFQLSKLCIVVDHANNSWNVVENFAEACSDDNWEYWDLITQNKNRPEFSPALDLQDVEVTIRYRYDPFLAYNEDEIDPTSKQLMIIGIICVSLAAIVTCFSWFYFWKVIQLAKKNEEEVKLRSSNVYQQT